MPNSIEILRITLEIKTLSIRHEIHTMQRAPHTQLTDKNGPELPLYSFYEDFNANEERQSTVRYLNCSL